MKIASSALESLRAHAAEGYPHEICGFLIGPHGSGEVTDTRRGTNIIVERAADRYELDPREQIRVQRETDAAGMDIVGYYHSHPDHPARPSVFDTERSWAGYVYIIVEVAQGTPAATGAFVPTQDGGPFRDEPLEVV